MLWLPGARGARRGIVHVPAQFLDNTGIPRMTRLRARLSVLIRSLIRSAGFPKTRKGGTLNGRAGARVDAKQHQSLQLIRLKLFTSFKCVDFFLSLCHFTELSFQV